MFSSFFYTYHLCHEIKYSGYITNLAYDCYIYLSCLCVKMEIKGTKCSKYNKNNK